MINTIPIIIDVEASGLNAGSYPIEIGVAMPEGANFCSLIRPETTWTHWDNDTELLNGITKQMLAQYGKPVTEVASRLNQLLEDTIVYSNGWGYHQAWLNLLFRHAGLVQTFKLEPLTSIMSDHQMRMWERTKSQVIRKFNLQRHRASSNAKILQLTYLRSLEKKLQLV